MLTLTKTSPAWLLRVLRIAFFMALIAVCAKIKIAIPGTPVPITLQVLSVLLAGMVAGPVEGGLSVLGYLGLIAIGLPLDANSRGALALLGPTAGFLIGFVPCAALSGLVRFTPAKYAQYQFFVCVGAGLLGLVVLYFFGTLGLLPFAGGSWIGAFGLGAVPFIVIDVAKVFLAASMVILGRESWLRWITPGMGQA
jgi:biotin transport system substrate-specific component